MVRTQIYFPVSLHKDLKTGAKMMHVSFSEYIRLVLEEKIYSKTGKIPPLPRKKGRLSLLAKNAVNLGPKDLAKNFGQYLENSLK